MRESEKILVIAHVYYPQLWPELARGIRNIDAPHDLIVTYGDEESVAEARRDFPAARFLRCEGVGYDVWPFLKALQMTDLGRYGYLVKLHTKRNIDQDLATNHALFSDGRWRRYLLEIVRTRRSWRRAFAKLRRPGIGMVADRRVIYDRKANGPGYSATFDAALAEVERIVGRRGEPPHLFVAGSMFAARMEPFRLLTRERFTVEMFEQPKSHKVETFAHVVERMLGFCVSAAGLRVDACNGSIRWRLMYYGQSPLGKFLRFFFQIRTRDFTYVVKILQIPVYVKRMKRIDQLVGCHDRVNVPTRASAVTRT